MTILKTKEIDEVEDKNCYLRVLEKAYVFLIKFVRKNPTNQKILIEHIDQFMEHIEYGVHSWELIAEIFSDSELLLSF
jgi:hypothetical protein